MACRAGVKYLPCSTTRFTASLHTHDQIQVDEVDDASRENMGKQDLYPVLMLDLWLHLKSKT